MRTFLNLLKENTGIKVGDKVYYAAEELQSVVSKVMGDKVEIEDAEGEKMMVSMSAVKKIGNGREVQQQEGEKGFTDNRKNIDLAEPKGKITAADFEALRNKKESVSEGGDHEVSMAMTSLQEIVEAAQELMSKLGGQERNIPGWIQNHITNAQNYIVQASQGFHELHEKKEKDDTSLTKILQELRHKK